MTMTSAEIDCNPATDITQARNESRIFFETVQGRGCDQLDDQAIRNLPVIAHMFDERNQPGAVRCSRRGTFTASLSFRLR